MKRECVSFSGVSVDSGGGLFGSVFVGRQCVYMECLCRLRVVCVEKS